MILNVVSLLAPDGLVWVLHKLLIYWDFPHTAISRVYRERSEKGNIPRERSSLEENATIAVSENTDSWIILSLVWDSVKCHKIFQYCCKHGVPNNLSRFMNSKGLRQETKELLYKGSKVYKWTMNLQGELTSLFFMYKDTFCICQTNVSSLRGTKHPITSYRNICFLLWLLRERVFLAPHIE